MSAEYWALQAGNLRQERDEARADVERLRAAMDRIARHPHATGEIRRYAGDALGRFYNADGECTGMTGTDGQLHGADEQEGIDQ